MYRTITALVVSVFIIVSLRAQENMTLANCIDYALANHSDIRIAELSMKDAEWQIKENRSVAYPRSASVSMSITSCFSLRFLLRPWDSGSLGMRSLLP